MKKNILYIIFLLIKAKKIFPKCWSEKLGFKCCRIDIQPIFSDYEGIWGVEDDQWCGIINSPSKTDNCLNNNCCTKTDTHVSFIDDEKSLWGIESGSWCKININNNNNSDNCWSSKYGYGCCFNDNDDVIYRDEKGSWGIENNQWCGL
ncbi:hypothetical protein BCR36DRAFT_281146, partial [Piromyces finnis]